MASIFDKVRIPEAVQNTGAQIADKIGALANDAGTAVQGLSKKTQDAVVKAMDENGNGEIDIEDIIIKGMKLPGIRIERAAFLQRELFKSHTQAVIDDAIAHNPAHAGISVEEIDKIADNIIQSERLCVSGISAALGAPGGAAMAATIPADILQYYGYMLRVAQKLLYLYGFPSLFADENQQVFDSEIMNMLILCLGTMYGVASANNAIKAMAKGLAVGVERILLKKALMKGTIYPIVKKVARVFGQKMTKEIFAGFFKKSIPVVGGVLGGGITYLSFKPCCDKLKGVLRSTRLSDPSYSAADEEVIVIEDVDEAP